ncbi:MAG: heat-inducible transcriptional repressor HrcA [Pyramidobacter sp.]|nr:heat-inducible transcriptional repressor HrcA [Pyramidobacter sp.]
MLTERQLEIVLAVVYEYIQTGEPVGSRTISKKFLKSHSAATIRNEMSDLEEMGYFSQPHSSAGRLPTSMAYRVYVNSILHRPTVPPPEIKRWMTQMSNQLQGLDERLKEVTRFLGRFTQCFSVAAVAAVEDLKLQKVDFIRLSSDVVLLLLVLEGGIVHHRRVQIKSDITQEHLDSLSHIINRMASGRPWGSVRDSLNTYLAQQLSGAWDGCRSAFEGLDWIMSGDSLSVSTGGFSEIFTAGDGNDDARGSIRAISAIMEDRKGLETLIHDYAAPDGLKVTIGDEISSPSMQGCSVMMSTASEQGRKAVVGLIGPLRMNYQHSIAVLEAVLSALNRPAADKEESQDG